MQLRRWSAHNGGRRHIPCALAEQSSEHGAVLRHGVSDWDSNPPPRKAPHIPVAQFTYALMSPGSMPAHLLSTQNNRFQQSPVHFVVAVRHISLTPHKHSRQSSEMVCSEAPAHSVTSGGTVLVLPT